MLQAQDPTTETQDRVLAERSNGQQSIATIVEYDEVFETYTIDVAHGVLKYGVEESYITPHETSDEWVGPSARRPNGSWEGFFVGRRVRIPLDRAVGARSADDDDDDDDRNGAVQCYDEQSGLYHVLLDSGAMRCNVPFAAIKVVFRGYMTCY